MGLLSVAVKEFENRLTFGEVMGKSLVSCFFHGAEVYGSIAVERCDSVFRCMLPVAVARSSSGGVAIA